MTDGCTARCGFCSQCAIAEKDADLAALRERLAAAERDIELNIRHADEARDERDKMRAWLCDQGLDARYGAECDVPGCPKLWEAEVAELKKRAETAEAKVAAAERAGIERAADEAWLEAQYRNPQGWTIFTVIASIRALLPAAVAEPEPSGISGELPAAKTVPMPSPGTMRMRYRFGAEPAAKCATPCLICGGKTRVCYHADACVASQYPLPGRCIASAGECHMDPPCVVFEVDCPSCSAKGGSR